MIRPHYDFETDNIFYAEEDARYCSIDFDDAMMHWFMMDITSAISDLLDQESKEARRKIELFLNGYRSIKALDESRADLIPVFRTFADLYTFARLVRSVVQMDIAGSPERAVRLRDKLLGACDRIRSRYQPAISLRPIAP